MKNICLLTTVMGLLLTSQGFAAPVLHTSTTMTGNKTIYHNVKYQNLLSIETRQELQTDIEQHIKKYDLDGDHYLSSEEFKSCHMSQGDSETRVMDKFNELDANNNGLVSSQEIMNHEMKLRADEALMAPVHVHSTVPTNVTYQQTEVNTSTY